MNISAKDLGTAYDLLRKNSTIRAVQDYLRARDISYAAGSWPELYEKRIVPALQQQKLGRVDILRMLRDAEEHGKQHVFLYKCSRSDAQALVNDGELKKNLAEMNLSEILSEPRIVNQAVGLQLVEARIDTPKRGMRSLILKATDLRSFRKLISQTRDGERETLVYETEHERAVNLIVVREDGRTEIRIQSYKNALDYAKAAQAMFDKVVGLVDQLRFSPISLAKARITAVVKRKELCHLVRFSDTQLRDKEGRTITVATGASQQELYPDGSATDKGVQGFLSVGKPECDNVDCFWLKRDKSPVPSLEVHTLIDGADNEVAFTAKLERVDYDYALDQVINLTR